MLNQGPESYVLHRKLGHIPTKVAYGKDVFVYDTNGKQYLDACGGAAVSCLGHADPDVNAAVNRQMNDVAYVHSGFFTSDVTEKLAEKLISVIGGTARAALFFNSGSEAMEAAIKMARQFHLEDGQKKRNHIIARKHSYHGTTLGALAIGGLKGRQEPFKDWLMQSTCSKISTCYPYRGMNKNETQEEYGLRIANQLETEILRVGADKVAAFVAETVPGATLGAIPPVTGYFKRVREICDQYNVLLILDEVMCGMGRCGDWLASHFENIHPDIVCIAKGLGGGYQPIASMVINQRVYSALERGSRSFMHGQTYMGHATACAAALAVIKKIIDRDYLQQVKLKGQYLEQRLREQFKNHEHIGDIRGRGLFWGIEIVSDRNSKKPFPSTYKLHQNIKSIAFNNGLLCYPGGGALKHDTGDHVLLAPPFIMNQQHLSDAVEILSRSINLAINDARSN